MNTKHKAGQLNEVRSSRPKGKSKKPIATIKEGMDGGIPSNAGALLTTRAASCAYTIKNYSRPVKFADGEQMEVNHNDLIDEIHKFGDAIVDNKFSPLVRMLTAQTMALNSIFNNLAQKATEVNQLKQIETLLKLALKAQSQARCTAEALAEIKNPRPYINQANIAQGHQQVNNSYASSSGQTTEPLAEIVDQSGNPDSMTGMVIPKGERVKR